MTFANHRTIRQHRLLLRYAALLLTLACALRSDLHADITGADVKQSIDKAVKFLRTTQAADGRWHYRMPHYSDGSTSLVGLALLNADVPADDPAIERALEVVAESRNQYTYVVALKAMFLAQADPKKYDREIQQAATWLSEAQLQSGMWTYKAGQGRRGDNSNTQFGVLGLYAAERAGARVPEGVWQRAERHFNKTVLNDGGWGYAPGQNRATLSMTCAGVASLYMTGLELLDPTHRCGEYEFNSRIVWGLNWIGKRFDIDGRVSSHHLYMLYAIERVGVIGARRHLGRHDWYREGTEFLLENQNDGGSWGNRRFRGGRGVGELNVATAFGLLFLGKGRAPVMVNKLKYPVARDAGAWNLHPYDARNLVAHASEAFEQPASWQVIELDAPLKELVRAPILYLNGHEAFTLNAEARTKLRKYVEQGGTIFSVACCSQRHTGFDTSVRKLYGEIFPERELRPIADEHAIYSAYYNVKSRGEALSGIDFGCRTAVIHSTERVSCAWQGERVAHDDTFAKLGVNVCAYATGMEPLMDKLDEVKLVEVSRPEKREVLRGAVVPAQLKYPGRWDNDRMALANLMEHLRTEAGVDVANKRKVVGAGDPELFNHPILYITGAQRVKFGQDVTRRMRDYLDKGGFVFADASGGNEAFVKSFRQWANTLYPDAKLVRVPLDHALYNTGVKVEKVRYKAPVLKEHPGLDRPTLEGIEHDGRLVVVFSPYDIGCALAGFKGSAPGYTVESAFDVAGAAMLYALTH
jgi:hypothetical protein